jgi:hypothetical protein
MPAVRTMNITCPGCQTILVVNKDTGTILEVRAPLVDNPSGDRFADALQAHKDHKDKLKGLFSESVAGVSEQEKERRAIFEESLKKARQEGVSDEPELRDIDLD